MFIESEGATLYDGLLIFKIYAGAMVGQNCRRLYIKISEGQIVEYKGVQDEEIAVDGVHMKINIPSFIKIIDPFAFDLCTEIKKVDTASCFITIEYLKNTSKSNVLKKEINSNVSGNLNNPDSRTDVISSNMGNAAISSSSPKATFIPRSYNTAVISGIQNAAINSSSRNYSISSNSPEAAFRLQSIQFLIILRSVHILLNLIADQFSKFEAEGGEKGIGRGRGKGGMINIIQKVCVLKKFMITKSGISSLYNANVIFVVCLLHC